MHRLLRSASAVLLGLVLLPAGCGGDDEEAAAPTEAMPVAQQNACPVDGCTIEITDAEEEGDELRLTWTANFSPDFSKNHIHVYWDTYTADQVSNDAADRGETQGEWVPTDAYPDFVTEGVVSTASREGSTSLCVTAADRDHNVLDSALTDCHDVSALL
jgi:hypothetical protein